MDHTKTKTFIAFVNKDGKNRWWVDGNYVFDEISPKVYPYETKEDKEHAKLIGYRIAIWNESGDIEGILLKATGESMPTISKKEALLLEDKLFPKPIREDVPKKEKKKVEEIVEPVATVPERVVEKVSKKSSEKVEKVLEKPVEIVRPPEEKRGRGRPRKLFDE